MAYSNIKDAFLTKFAQIDEILPMQDQIGARALLTEFI